MPQRQVDVVVRGDAELRLGVGRRLACALEAEGADVWVESSVPEVLHPPTDLRGVSIRLAVRPGSAERRHDGGSYNRQFARLVIGLVILLAVLGVEVRLSFGPRVAVLSLVVGAVVMWRSHGRRARTG